MTTAILKRRKMEFLSLTFYVASKRSVSNDVKSWEYVWLCDWFKMHVQRVSANQGIGAYATFPR